MQGSPIEQGSVPLATTVSVAVSGGSLAVEFRPSAQGSAAPLVVLIHGITASSRSWSLVVDRLGPQVAVAAVDLRGRGDSAGIRGSGPYGIAQHALDIESVASELGTGPVVLVGHSMGGWIAAMAAPLLASRVRGVVLVDGGWGLDVATDGDPDRVLETVLGPALDRLSQQFATREDYYQFWRDHPALTPPGVWTDAVVDYLDHDLGPGSGPHRSRVVADAVRADGIDIMCNPEVRSSAASLAVPTELLRVDRGLMDEPSPVVPLNIAEQLAAQNSFVTVTTVPGLNHYSILFAPAGADAVAAAVGRALAV